MIDRDLARERRACLDLERAVRRAARSVSGVAIDLDAELAQITGGPEPDAVLPALTLADWVVRRRQLFGLQRWLLALQYARTQYEDVYEFLRLKIYAEDPERVELTSGHVVACYPVTAALAERIAQRSRILLEATSRIQALETTGAPDAVLMRRRLEAIRLWQRCALMWEVTLRPGQLADLPTDPPLAARLALRVFGWCDGLATGRERWRTRALLAWGWRQVDRLTGAHRWLGIPPWWTWLATPIDELAIMRANLLANEERMRALPSLPSSGTPDRFGYSNFLNAFAEARGQLATHLIHDRTLAALFLDAGQQQARQVKQEREQKQRERQEAAAPRRGKARG